MNGFDEQNTPDVSDNNTNSQPNQAPETPYTQETQENAAPQQNPYYAQPDPQNPNNQYTYGNPQQGYPVQPPMYVEQKSKMAAGLLGIFLGSLGVHNFYLGYTGKAVAQLLISVLSCFVLSPVSGIWGLIEGIMILSGSITVDGKGVLLKD